MAAFELWFFFSPSIWTKQQTRRVQSEGLDPPLDIAPVFKKDDKNAAKNCKSVSVLPKVFEDTMQKQFGNHTNDFLPPYLCGYRKRFSTQYTLL